MFSSAAVTATALPFAAALSPTIANFPLRAALDTTACGKGSIIPYASELAALHNQPREQRWSLRMAALAAP
jgi:uncharacterized protein YbcC (UPF0753/DUF2309 family)